VKEEGKRGVKRMKSISCCLNYIFPSIIRVLATKFGHFLKGDLKRILERERDTY